MLRNQSNVHYGDYPKIRVRAFARTLIFGPLQDILRKVSYLSERPEPACYSLAIIKPEELFPFSIFISPEYFQNLPSYAG